jgi:drug/metabolite transporter superfamily protein YnfA
VWGVLNLLTGFALVLEAFWIGMGTTVVMPFIASSYEFEGGLPMSSLSAFLGYGAGFGVAALAAVAGSYLIGLLPMLKRLGPWIVLGAAVVNAFIAITAAVSTMASRDASVEGYWLALVTGGVAVMATVSWRQVVRQAARAR